MDEPTSSLTLNEVADLFRLVRRLRADGTLHRLARTWLGIDPARLSPLR